MENVKLTAFAEHLDLQYGKKGSPKREKYELQFEVFKKKVLLEEIKSKTL